MAGKMKKQDETRTLEFEVFDLDLNDDELQQLAADPRGFLGNLLEEEGQTVNDLLITSDDKFLAATSTPSTWHCTSPPNMKSKWITIIA